MHLIPPPNLPADAPFDTAQRNWLKGFFDGLSAVAPDGARATEHITDGPSACILWGSQTGSSEGVAKKLSKNLTKKGFKITVTDMADTDLAALSKETNVFIITSTYGDGEPPDNAAALHEEMMADGAPPLTDVHFSVLALGDSEYPDFCQCGKEFDIRFEELGATRISPRIDCDVDYDDELVAWEKALIENLLVTS